MFLRSKRRCKDGKAHCYFSVVENRRVVQRQILLWGEINDTQQVAWRETLEVFDEAEQRAKEQAIRRRPDASGLWKRRDLRRKCPARHPLLLRIGAAKKEAGRAFGFVRMHLPREGEEVTRQTFTFGLDKEKLKKAEFRDGHYLLRSNPVGEDPASREGVEKELGKPSRSSRELAFQTILKNRTCQGGILAPGSRPIRHGENGKGILSRWYPTTLARRIRNIARICDRISFKTGEGIQAIIAAANDPGVVFFIDAPYTASGKKAGDFTVASSSITRSFSGRSVKSQAIS